ncbi:2930_t:CDS:2 [Ambispora leptoticha]|uniref:Peptide hydrolase n=1 Tax=Ambispora leptoticha TaxID=144679 RepID=A0A9N9A8F3_9GLOM|nr:2930_t:CDS:2 [Ambispora leptoticha]
MILYSFLVIIFIFVGNIIAYTTFSEDELPALIALDIPNSTYKEFLKPLLVKRVSGTEQHAKVQEFIVNQFTNLGWHVERDNFTSVTPLGEKPFSNIIVTKDIAISKRLVLAAHYDSKYFEPPNDNFIGATDSAFPCALLIDLAYSLNQLLSDQNKADVTLQIIFFDGEEAFRDWTDTDSLYGSRHLAKKWEETYITRTDYFQHQATSLLDGIEALVLLDLLGAKDPKITNYFPTTSWLYKNIARIEERLWKQSLLKEDEDDLDKDFMFDSSLGSSVLMNIISDDHVPFMIRGVPILHIITEPFPSVWHKLDDNEKALDPDIMYNLNLIIRIFVAEYFDLKPLSLSAKNNTKTT